MHRFLNLFHFAVSPFFFRSLRHGPRVNVSSLRYDINVGKTCKTAKTNVHWIFVQSAAISWDGCVPISRWLWFLLLKSTMIFGYIWGIRGIKKGQQYLENLGNAHILFRKIVFLNESFLELVHSETHPLRGQCCHAPWESRRCHPVLIVSFLERWEVQTCVNIEIEEIESPPCAQFLVLYDGCQYCQGSLAARFWHPKWSNSCFTHCFLTSFDPTNPPWHHSWHGRTCDGCHGTPLVPATPAKPRKAARQAEARSGPAAAQGQETAIDTGYDWGTCLRPSEFQHVI